MVTSLPPSSCTCAPVPVPHQTDTQGSSSAPSYDDFSHWTLIWASRQCDAPAVRMGYPHFVTCNAPAVGMGCPPLVTPAWWWCSQASSPQGFLQNTLHCQHGSWVRGQHGGWFPAIPNSLSGEPGARPWAQLTSLGSQTSWCVQSH